MANFYGKYPGIFGGGGGSGNGVPIYASLGVFPSGTQAGQLAVAADTGFLYEWNGSAWVKIAPTGSGGTPFQEVPTGTINNVNVTFTVSQTPFSAAAFELFQDGLVLIQNTDYTLSGSTITMTVAPNFGQTLYAVYSIASATAGNPYQETPGGTINGVNTAFTVVTAPSDPNAFDLFQDGLILKQNIDYTISGLNITMTIAPPFGATLWATYTVNTGGTTGVSSLNGSTGAMNILAGSGISVTTLGQNITVAATAAATLRVDGTRASPQLITAVGGILFTSTAIITKKYIAGNGGAVIVTANPQIAAGTVDGQQLIIQSRHVTNTVELQDGTGLSMNGPWIGGLNSSITFSWDTSAWVEMSRQ